MATISNAERNAIIDLVMTVSGEDYGKAAVCLDMLQTGLPAIAWATILRTRAATWPAYVASGLSVTWWVDEVIRYAAVAVAGRS